MVFEVEKAGSSGWIQPFLWEQFKLSIKQTLFCNKFNVFSRRNISNINLSG